MPKAQVESKTVNSILPMDSSKVEYANEANINVQMVTGKILNNVSL